MSATAPHAIRTARELFETLRAADLPTRQPPPPVPVPAGSTPTQVSSDWQSAPVVQGVAVIWMSLSVVPLGMARKPPR